jgi:phage repressor protein C with HTH and peptisase S24 domain
MDAEQIIEALKRYSVPHERIAEAIGRDRTTATKLIAGKRTIKVTEVPALHDLVAEFERDAGESARVRRVTPVDEAEDGLIGDYVSINVLPSYAGMGGGGSGEGDRAVARLPRRLIEEELRGNPEDFELIDVRGDSNFPEFHNGDQILIDKRDRNPVQPGFFALWDGDGYVVKKVERVPQRRGWYRIFSANTQYREYEVEETETTIMGRPVWFARRL